MWCQQHDISEQEPRLAARGKGSSQKLSRDVGYEVGSGRMAGKVIFDRSKHSQPNVSA